MLNPIMKVATYNYSIKKKKIPERDQHRCKILLIDNIDSIIKCMKWKFYNSRFDDNNKTTNSYNLKMKKNVLYKTWFGTISKRCVLYNK